MRHIIKDKEGKLVSISLKENELFISSVDKEEKVFNINDFNDSNHENVLNFISDEYNIDFNYVLSENDIEDYKNNSLEELLIYYSNKINNYHYISSRLSHIQDNSTYYFNNIKDILNNYYSLDYETEIFKDIIDFKRLVKQYRSLLEGYIDFFIELENFPEENFFNIGEIKNLLNRMSGLKSNKIDEIEVLDSLKSNILISMLSYSKYEESDDYNLEEILKDISNCNIVIVSEPKTMKNSLNLISEKVSEMYYDSNNRNYNY